MEQQIKQFWKLSTKKNQMKQHDNSVFFLHCESTNFVVDFEFSLWHWWKRNQISFVFFVQEQCGESGSQKQTSQIMSELVVWSETGTQRQVLVLNKNNRERSRERHWHHPLCRTVRESLTVKTMSCTCSDQTLFQFAFHSILIWLASSSMHKVLSDKFSVVHLLNVGQMCLVCEKMICHRCVFWKPISSALRQKLLRGSVNWVHFNWCETMCRWVQVTCDGSMANMSVCWCKKGQKVKNKEFSKQKFKFCPSFPSSACSQEGNKSKVSAIFSLAWQNWQLADFLWCECQSHCLFLSSQNISSKTCSHWMLLACNPSKRVHTKQCTSHFNNVESSIQRQGMCKKVGSVMKRKPTFGLQQLQFLTTCFSVVVEFSALQKMTKSVQNVSQNCKREQQRTRVTQFAKLELHWGVIRQHNILLVEKLSLLHFQDKLCLVFSYLISKSCHSHVFCSSSNFFFWASAQRHFIPFSRKIHQWVFCFVFPDHQKAASRDRMPCIVHVQELLEAWQPLVEAFIMMRKKRTGR